MESQLQGSKGVSNLGLSLFADVTRQGRQLAQYDPQRSFLPLVLYDAQIDCSLNPPDSALQVRLGPGGCTASRSDSNSNMLIHLARGQPSAWLGRNCLPWGVNASLYVKAGFNAVLPCAHTHTHTHSLRT